MADLKQTSKDGGTADQAPENKDTGLGDIELKLPGLYEEPSYSLLDPKIAESLRSLGVDIDRAESATFPTGDPVLPNVNHHRLFTGLPEALTAIPDQPADEYKTDPIRLPEYKPEKPGNGKRKPGEFKIVDDPDRSVRVVYGTKEDLAPKGIREHEKVMGPIREGNGNGKTYGGKIVTEKKIGNNVTVKGSVGGYVDRETGTGLSSGDSDPLAGTELELGSSIRVGDDKANVGIGYKYKKAPSGNGSLIDTEEKGRHEIQVEGRVPLTDKLTGGAIISVQPGSGSESAGVNQEDLLKSDIDGGKDPNVNGGLYIEGKPNGSKGPTIRVTGKGDSEKLEGSVVVKVPF